MVACGRASILWHEKKFQIGFKTYRRSWLYFESRKDVLSQLFDVWRPNSQLLRSVTNVPRAPTCWLPDSCTRERHTFDSPNPLDFKIVTAAAVSPMVDNGLHEKLSGDRRNLKRFLSYCCYWCLLIRANLSSPTSCAEKRCLSEASLETAARGRRPAQSRGRRPARQSQPPRLGCRRQRLTLFIGEKKIG